MDPNEMRSLESKTREIVETLSSLERETLRQRKMGDQLEDSKVAILRLASELAQNADKLSEAIELLRRSTLAMEIERLDSKIDDVSALANLVGDNIRNAEEICRSTAELASDTRDSIEEVSTKLLGIERTHAELLKRVESLGRESEVRDADIANKLLNLESVIGRIDRNTQKGFGKERG
jgi:methyl-accepting chemotaxis protein